MPWFELYCSIISPKTKNAQMMTEMGHYMDVRVKPAGKVSEESL